MILQRTLEGGVTVFGNDGETVIASYIQVEQHIVLTLPNGNKLQFGSEEATLFYLKNGTIQQQLFA